MSVNYVDKSTGDLIRVAGQGKAEYGASTERKGDIVIPATTAGNFQTVNVVFAQAMPDNDYAVVIDEGTDTWAHCTTNVTNKTAAGFTVFFLNVTATDAPQMAFKYRAFKLYTDTEYNNLLNNAILTSDVTDAVTNGDMNPVTSNAVYDALNTVQSGTGIRDVNYVRADGFVCNWYKVGRICTVNIQYNLSQETPSGINIILGLPRPIVEIACVGEGYDNTNASGFVIQGDGNVRTHYVGANQQFVHGTATYITAE